MIDKATTESGSEHTVRYGLLFGVIAVLFLALPFLKEGSFGDLLLDALFLSVLLAALQAVRGDRRIVIAAAVMGTGLLASPGWGLFDQSMVTAIVSSLAMIGFTGLAVYALALDVYRSKDVDFGTILGACSVYLLLGLVWVGIFSLIEAIQPNSFAFVETHPDDMEHIVGDIASPEIGKLLIRRTQLFYYTFVTVTTLGYGDIRPVGDVARVYATIAAISGQLFIAILVARMVGIHSAQVGQRPHDD